MKGCSRASTLRQIKGSWGLSLLRERSDSRGAASLQAPLSPNGQCGKVGGAERQGERVFVRARQQQPRRQGQGDKRALEEGVTTRPGRAARRKAQARAASSAAYPDGRDRSRAPGSSARLESKSRTFANEQSARSGAPTASRSTRAPAARHSRRRPRGEGSVARCSGQAAPASKRFTQSSRGRPRRSRGAVRPDSPSGARSTVCSQSRTTRRWRCRGLATTPSPTGVKPAEPSRTRASRSASSASRPRATSSSWPLPRRPGQRVKPTVAVVVGTALLRVQRVRDCASRSSRTGGCLLDGERYQYLPELAQTPRLKTAPPRQSKTRACATSFAAASASSSVASCNAEDATNARVASPAPFEFGGDAGRPRQRRDRF